MGFDNLKSMQLITQIKTLIGDSQLPICVVYYMLKDLLREVEELYSDVIQAEQKTYIEDQEKIKETVINGIQEHPIEFKGTIEDLRDSQEKESSGQE